MRALVLASVVALAACSSSSGSGSNGDGGTSGASIDCAWLNDANSCYAKFLSDVTSCIGGAGGPGVLDADNRTCTYPGGDPLITFAIPLGTTLPGGSNGMRDMHFTVTSGGVTCLDHTEHLGDFGFTSKGPNGTFAIAYVSNAVTVSCPDGSTLHGDVGALTAQCKSDFDAKMPGTYWSETNPTFTFKPASLIWHCGRTL